MGEYATWTCVKVEVSVILGLELGQMNLNHFSGISCSPIVDMIIVDCMWVIKTLEEDVGMQRVAFCGWCLSRIDNSR